MRHFFSLMFCLLAMACSNTKSTITRQYVLNGRWLPVHQEIGGKSLPKAVFEKQQLIIADSNYTVVAESVDNGVIRFSGADKMDIYGKDGVNAGKHFTAMYKYEHEQLTVCYNLAGDRYPDSLSTKGNIMYFLSVFKKASTN